MSNLILGRLVAVAGFVVLVLGVLLWGSTAAEVLGIAGVVGGTLLARNGSLEKSKEDYRSRRKVLLGARRMIESESQLDDTRLATILQMDVVEVSRGVDFGMNTGYLPTDPSQGVFRQSMGYLYVDLIKGPLDTGWFNKPTLWVGSEIYGRSWGSKLAILKPGPYQVVVEMKYRVQNHTIKKRTGTGVYVEENKIKGIYFLSPPGGMFFGGKIAEFDSE
ncbi:hypothetical protein GF402_01850 [Candidatus Fermentibacteria bacterium]|nr:hypothetical protein [Candidatus Fermentibacteria bacterium]